jgi:hypothetical protein
MNMESSNGGKRLTETQRVGQPAEAMQTANKKVDFNKTATDGFSIQSAIKRSILKQHNMNSTTQNSGVMSQNKTERSTNNSISRGGATQHAHQYSQ